jgi:hypothetical protein
VRVKLGSVVVIGDKILYRILGKVRLNFVDIFPIEQPVRLLANEVAIAIGPPACIYPGRLRGLGEKCPAHILGVPDRSSSYVQVRVTVDGHHLQHMSSYTLDTGIALVHSASWSQTASILERAPSILNNWYVRVVEHSPYCSHSCTYN